MLDSAMLEAYQAGRSAEEVVEFEEWFGISEIREARPLHSKTEDTRQDQAAPSPPSEVAPTPDSSLASSVSKSSVSEQKSSVLRHVVSTTVFWKHVGAKDPELPRPTRESLVDAKRLGLVKRFSPWDSYIEPLFLHSSQMMKRHPQVEFACHLASDFDFYGDEWFQLAALSPRFAKAGILSFIPLEARSQLLPLDIEYHAYT